MLGDTFLITGAKLVRARRSWLIPCSSNLSVGGGLLEAAGACLAADNPAINPRTTVVFLSFHFILKSPLSQPATTGPRASRRAHPFPPISHQTIESQKPEIPETSPHCLGLMQEFETSEADPYQQPDCGCP